MGSAFTPEQLHRMFEAFDRARRVSPEHSDTIAARIIDAASRGFKDADDLFAAAVKSGDGKLDSAAVRPPADGAGGPQPAQPRR